MLLETVCVSLAIFVWFTVCEFVKFPVYVEGSPFGPGTGYSTVPYGRNLFIGDVVLEVVQELGVKKAEDVGFAKFMPPPGTFAVEVQLAS
jgi:hypothetical protein